MKSAYGFMAGKLKRASYCASNLSQVMNLLADKHIFKLTIAQPNITKKPRTAKVTVANWLLWLHLEISSPSIFNSR